MNIPKTVSDKIVFDRKFFFNKYSIAFIIFVVWISFFDSKNIFVQYKLSKRIAELKKEKREYLLKYQDALQKQKDMQNDIEKFARENFYMHKDNEDVFIVK